MEAETPPTFYRVPDEEVSQGDVVMDVPHLYLKQPPITVLRSTTGSGRRPLFEPFPLQSSSASSGQASDVSPPGGFKFARGEPEQVVATCFLAKGIILTHGCEIDKDPKHRIVALLRPLRTVPQEHHDIVRSNQDFSSLYLPEYPGILEESYVDFRRISTVHSDLILPENRLASLTTVGLQALLTKLFLYITRANVEDIVSLMGDR